jgi:iron complex outermembrane receptor protein
MVQPIHRRSLPLAAAVSMALFGAQVSAQNRNTTTEEIVVVGSFIEGTPEDAALPVEVITYEDLKDLGRPSNLDLIKTMSEIGQVAGEADRSNSFPIGAASVNLRNLGSRFTTVLFNGRRFPEQTSPITGRFNNVAWIPNAAIGRVETLKGGGAATYGADAIAGVVNYVTRKDFDGIELNADYRYIEDSDGDYGADALIGHKFDRGNFLMSLAYQHRSPLEVTDRDWAVKHYLENDAAYSTNASPGAYLFQGRAGATYVPITPLSPSIYRYGGDRHMSITGIVRDPNCTALGGFAGWSATPSPVCHMPQNLWSRLVNDQDTYQAYAEFNFDITDNVELHTEALYYEIDLPDIILAPSDIPLSWPLAGNGRQMAGTTPTYYTSGRNPAVEPFLRSLTNSNGSATFTDAQIASIVNTGRAGMVFGTWRPFGVGGHPVMGDHDVQHNNTKLWRVTTGLSGDLPKFLGTDLSWDVSLTYNRVVDRREMQDIVVDRLQAALNGLGGPNCTGSTPGANGCQFLNPFSSGIERNIYTGHANPGYIGTGTYAGYTPGQGLQNDPALVAWMYEDIWLKRTYDYIVFDPMIRGDTGIDLPGGTIAIAFGGQFRWAREDTQLDDLSNRAVNPCPSLGVYGCDEEAQTGALAFTRPSTTMGATEESRRRFPVAAAFFEVQLPVLDTLDFGAAGRYEKFYSDVTDKDNAEFVPAINFKWQPLEWMAVRGSAGRTFSQVNPPEDDGPNIGTSIPSTRFGGFGGSQTVYTTANYDNVDVKSESGEHFDIGLLFQTQNFVASIDYFDVRVQDFARTLSSGGVLAAVVMPGESGTSALINCNSALFNPQAGLGGNPFVELNGPCIQGVSALDSVSDGASAGGLAGGRINYFGGNRETNAGELKTNGIDVAASYRFDNVFGGSLTPSVDFSYILEWELGDHVVAGVPISEGYDGIGYTNEATGRIGQAVPEWRGSFGVLYRSGRHTLNLLGRYIPSIKDDSDGATLANHIRNANVGDADGRTTTGAGTPANPAACTVGLSNPTSNVGNVPAGAGTGEYGGPSIGAGAVNVGTRGFCGAQNTSILSGTEIESDFNLDLTYRLELPWESDVTLSIYNLLDDEPSFAREALAYNSGFGSPLGRNYKVSFSKRF